MLRLTDRPAWQTCALPEPPLVREWSDMPAAMRWIRTHLDGWSLVDESGERLVLSVSRHYAAGPHYEAVAESVEAVPEALGELLARVVAESQDE